MTDQPPMRCVHNYCEVRPPRSTTRSVLSAWAQHVDAGNDGYTQTLLPDGCAEIIWRNDKPPVLIGPSSVPRSGTLRAGLTLAGVRLRPGSLRALGISPDELGDDEVLLRDVVGGLQCCDAFTDPPTPVALRAAMDQIDHALRGGPHPWTTFSARWLAEHPEAPVSELAAALEVSTRQLHRRFLQHVGLGPKRFQRVMRLHRFVAASHQQPQRSTAELAAETGFADQSHLIRETAALADRRPSQMQTDSYSTLAGSDLFNTPIGV